jgi:hypothetical protein
VICISALPGYAAIGSDMKIYSGRGSNASGFWMHRRFSERWFGLDISELKALKGSLQDRIFPDESV